LILFYDHDRFHNDFFNTLGVFETPVMRVGDR